MIVEHYLKLSLSPCVCNSDKGLCSGNYYDHKKTESSLLVLMLSLQILCSLIFDYLEIKVEH